MNKLLIFLFSGFILLISCGKPNDPESINPGDQSGGYKIVKKYTTAGYAQDVLKKDNLLYMAQGEGGLLILNIENPANPVTVSVTTEGVRGYCSRIAIKDSAVYLAAGSFGINILNVSDPYAPEVPVTNFGPKPSRNLYVMGDYLFNSNSELGFNISNISYPTEPDSRGQIVTNGYANAIRINSDTTMLFVACGEMGLSIYDISDFQQGYGEYPHIGWCDTPGYAEDIVILEEESVAFLACGTSGLQIINYADTNNVFITGSYDGGGYAKSLKYQDKRIYMACELGGLQVIDVSDLSHPVFKGQIETEFAFGLYVDENYVYLADEIEGLIIISIPD